MPNLIEQVTDTNEDGIFKSESVFSQYIIQRAVERDQTCMFTLLEFCDERDIDVDDVTKYMDRSLKARIADELREEGYAPAKHTEDIDSFF